MQRKTDFYHIIAHQPIHSKTISIALKEYFRHRDRDDRVIVKRHYYIPSKKEIIEAKKWRTLIKLLGENNGS